MLRAVGAVIRRMWSDSAVRFVFIGAVLFGIHSAAKPKPRNDSEPIVVTRALVDELVRERKRLGDTTVNVDRVVAQYVEDELLWREGKKLGLDVQDPIVRRRVIQKMTFLAEDSIGTRDPGDKTLRRFFEAHASEFALPARVSFRHVFFGRQRRGGRTEQDARKALEKLSAETPLAEALELGDPAITGSHLLKRTAEELRKSFGEEFASRVFAAKAGEWFGPVPSARGVHLVFIEHRDKGGAPRFADLRNAVYSAWALSEQQSAKRKLLEQLHRTYPVQIEPGAVASVSVSKAEP